jgi:hypothetical protein
VIKLRVIDTATFIEASKRANGDLYDYSQSVFAGWRKPILIGCNRCGKLINLKNAGSHYLKGCGCKACNSDRLSPCKICGVGVSSKVYHAQAKRCKACCDKAKQDRVTHKESKHGKHCKGCGVWFAKRDSFYCTAECRLQNVASRLVYSCCHCGGTVRKRSVSTARFQFCNKDCQTAFQGSIGYDRTGRIRSSANKSKLAKRKYRSEQSKQRKAISEGYQWWRLCRAQACKLDEKQKTRWDKRCQAALSSINSRFEPVFRLERQKLWTWESKISKERLNRLKTIRVSEEDAKWDRKIQQASRNAHKRRNRKVLRTGERG